jgi:hypothetical protein|tara:strand:+ start:512 stop:943 length:432 start_codon:yes stop_codon:yes gene_type:complete
MKNITTIILFTLLAFASLNAKAQGNLQFNRALTETIVDTTIGLSNGIVYDSLTVDSGKVLKITSVNCDVDLGMTNYITQYTKFKIRLNNILVSTLFLGSTSKEAQMPIWLPEGTYVIESYFLYGNDSERVKAVISGIEFNVVQ